MGRKTLVGSGQKKFALGKYPGLNHRRCKFWGRSVKAFLHGEGSNFRLFHRLSSRNFGQSKIVSLLLRTHENEN